MCRWDPPGAAPNSDRRSVAHEAALQEVRAFSRNSSAAGDGGPPAASIGRSSSSSIDVPHAHAAAPPGTNPAASSPRHAASVNRDSRRSVRVLHVPPVSSELQTFKPAPKPPPAEGDEEEDEGIQYVENLEVVGGVLGTTLKATGPPCLRPGTNLNATPNASLDALRLASPTICSLPCAYTHSLTRYSLRPPSPSAPLLLLSCRRVCRHSNYRLVSPGAQARRACLRRDRRRRE